MAKKEVVICSRLTREIYKCQTVLAPNPELQDGKKSGKS